MSSRRSRSFIERSSLSRETLTLLNGSPRKNVTDTPAWRAASRVGCSDDEAALPLISVTLQVHRVV